MKSDREFYESIQHKVQKQKEKARVTKARLCLHSAVLSLLLCCLCFVAMTPAKRSGGSVADVAPTTSSSPTDGIFDNCDPPEIEGDPHTSGMVGPIVTTAPHAPGGDEDSPDHSNPPEDAPLPSAPTQPEGVITTVPTVSDPDRHPDKNDHTLPPFYYDPNEATDPSDPLSFSSFLLPLAFGFLLLALLFFFLARRQRHHGSP